MIDGKDLDFEGQVGVLFEILRGNEKLWEVLVRLEGAGLGEYYVNAGAVYQTVFNYYHGHELNRGIVDVDIIYYDADTSYEAEDVVIKKVEGMMADLGLKLDVKNEARAHLWIPGRFGVEVDQYPSVESALETFGITAACVGVRLEDGKLRVHAPFGLQDIFDLTVRPVKFLYTQEEHERKCAEWLQMWPKLKMIKW